MIENILVSLGMNLREEIISFWISKISFHCPLASSILLRNPNSSWFFIEGLMLHISSQNRETSALYSVFRKFIRISLSTLTSVLHTQRKFPIWKVMSFHLRYFLSYFIDGFTPPCFFMFSLSETPIIQMLDILDTSSNFLVYNLFLPLSPPYSILPCFSFYMILSFAVGSLSHISFPFLSFFPKPLKNVKQFLACGLYTKSHRQDLACRL